VLATIAEYSRKLFGEADCTLILTVSVRLVQLLSDAMIGRRLQHAMVVRTATDDRPSLHHHAMVVLVLDDRQPLPRAAPHC